MARSGITERARLGLFLAVLALALGLYLYQQLEHPRVSVRIAGRIMAIRLMGKAGFASFQTLPFPQPCYPTGWWSCTLPVASRSW